MKHTNSQLLVLAALCSALSACSGGIDQANPTETSDRPASALPTTDATSGVDPQAAVTATNTGTGIVGITDTQETGVQLPVSPAVQQPGGGEVSNTAPVASRVPMEFQVTLISVEIRRAHNQTLIDMNIDPIQSDDLYLE